MILGFPFSSAGKESACNAVDLGSVSGLGRSPGEWNSYPFHYSGLESSTDGTVHGILKAKNTGVGCHLLLQRIFHMQGSNPGSPEVQADSLPSELPGSLINWKSKWASVN